MKMATRRLELVFHPNKWSYLSGWTHRPDLVMTISVPCWWNSSHSSLCSRVTWEVVTVTRDGVIVVTP